MDESFRPFLVKESAAVRLSRLLVREPLLEASPGSTFPYAGAAALLTEGGYSRADTVDGPGQFAIRGDRIDVWPFGAENPARILLFGNEVERTGTLDPESGCIVEDIPSVAVYAAGAAGSAGVTVEALYLLSAAVSLVEEGRLRNRRYPERAAAGLAAGGRLLVEASLVCRALHGRAESEVEKAVEEWARAAGCWRRDPEGEAGTGRTRLPGGVFPSFTDGEDVVEVIPVEESRGAAGLVDMLAAANAVFPDGARTVEGFGRDCGGRLAAVAKRTHAAGKRCAAERVRAAMTAAGLSRVPGTDAWHGNGVFIAGVEENLVEAADGRTVAVSFRAGLDTEDAGYGGRWRNPAPEGDARAVDGIAAFLDAVLPVETDRAAFVEEHEADTPMLDSQLEVTGRFDGYFSETDPWTGISRQTAVALKPGFPGTLLRMDCRDIFLMLGDDGKLPRKEHDEIGYGFGMWIDGTFTAFDIARGRLSEALPFMDTLRSELAREENERIMQGLRREKAEKSSRSRKRG